MPHQVRSLLWPDVLNQLDYWAENPPLHLLVKAFMGIKDAPEEKPLSAADFIAQAKERRP